MNVYILLFFFPISHKFYSHIIPRHFLFKMHTENGSLMQTITYALSQLHGQHMAWVLSPGRAAGRKEIGQGTVGFLPPAPATPCRWTWFQ